MTKVLDKDIMEAIEANKEARKKFMDCCAKDSDIGNDCMVALINFMGCETEQDFKDIFVTNKERCIISLKTLGSYVELDADKKSKMKTCDYVVFEDSIDSIKKSTIMFNELTSILTNMSEVRSKVLDLKKFLEE